MRPRTHLPSPALCTASLILAILASPVFGAVHHLVLFKYKEDAPSSEIQRVQAEFAALPARIPGIIGFQAGLNNSPEGLDRGFTHAYIITFENEAARDAYLPHPAHKDFVKIVGPVLEKPFVVDFEVESPAPVAEPGRVHHLVFFKFKKDAAPEGIRAVETEFAALPQKIPGLLSYQAGTNNSPENLADGFTHAFLLTFIHERARDDYLIHPAHKDFVKIVGPVLEAPLVVDFTVTPARQTLFVTEGLEPYRVYQRGEDGTATIRFGGVATDGDIEARLVAGRRTVGGFDWKKVGSATRGRFRAELTGVPTGGEYTVEVRARDPLGNVAAHTDVANVLVGDLWILAGQSNMEGVGDLIDVEQPSPWVHCFTMGHRWELAREPLHWLIDSPDPVHSARGLGGADGESERRRRRAAARTRRHKGAGLGLAFANELYRRTGVPVGLIASAHGGTSMAQWDPAKREEGGASLYGSMYKQVQNAGGQVAGVLWYQGESDANPGAVPQFAARFKGLVEAFRRDFKSPELPFYYVQIGRFVVRRDGAPWNQIQELQRQAEQEIPHTAVVSVIDLELDDLIHVGTQGLKRVGRRLAKVADRNLFGNKSLQLGPRLTKARLEGERTVRVEFESVNGSLHPRHKVEGFVLRDAQGATLPLIYKAAVDAARPSTVVLSLQNPLPAGATLQYGAGLDPVCNLVDDEDMAALVAGPIAIER